MKLSRFLIIASLVCTSAYAECRRSESIFGGYTVRCDDGNNYEVQKSELFDKTTVQGSNPYTGSKWNAEITGSKSVFGPTMTGTDKRGNHFNCTMNSLTKQWDCR